MLSNRSVPTDVLLPHVTYGDLEQAIGWLSRVFGFSEHYRYGDPLSGAQMHLGNAWIMLKQGPAGHNTPKQLGQGTQSLTVFVEKIKPHFERAQSAGAKIVEPLHETVYGELQYGAEDLEGHHWLFSRHARDLSPEQWGATVAEPIMMTSQVSLMLSVRHGKRAIDFYRDAFGAEELYRVESEDGGVVARLSLGSNEFWIADESPQHANFSPESLGGGSARMLVTVTNPDAFFERAVAKGARVVCPIADQPYGWRVGRVRDPFGHDWEIGRPLAGSAKSAYLQKPKLK